MGDKDLYDDVSATRILTVRDIIFDFEGTLVDFQWQLVPAVEECLAALADAGFKRHWYGSNPTYASIYNQTLSLSQAGKGQADPHLDMAIIDAIYDMYDADALTRWHLYSDTLETLATLKGMGFKMGLVSNVGSKALRSALDRLDLANLLSVVISRNDVDRLKPSADGLLLAAAKLQADPADIILIGDSRDDVGAAREAGMLVAYLVGGQDSMKDMAPFPADVIITRLNQLPACLTRATEPTKQ